MTVLIIAEHENQQLAPTICNAIQAAKQLGEVHVLLAGNNTESLAKNAAQLDGVQKVLRADAPHYDNGLAEEIAPLVVSLAADYRYIITTSGAFGKNIAPRVAALLDCSQVSDVTEIIDKETFVHPIYAGNALETVKVSANVTVLTIRNTAFDPVASTGGHAEVSTVAVTEAQNLSEFISKEVHKTDRPELTQAQVIVSGGRGLGSKEQFDALMLPLADALGAAIGASRAAVDAEYAPNDWQVGQTGKVVAPQLYIAVGISGAIQHVAGMQDSKVIVAINKDSEAPIFNIADYGLVADLFDVVPELTQSLQQ